MTIRNTRTGGQILVDQLVRKGVDRAFCVPGESYLAALDALYDAPIARHRLPAGRRRRDDGRGLWQADRPARHLLRHPRPRRHQCLRRRPYRPAGFDADDPVHRPGRARMREREAFQEIDYRALFGDVAKWVAEIDDARAHSRVRRARLPPGDARAGPGPVVLSLPEDMLTETADVADAAPLGRSRPSPALPNMAQLRAAAGARPSGRSSSSAARAGPTRRAQTSRASPSASTCRSAAPSAARCCSTTMHPQLCRRRRHRHQPEAGRARQGRPTCVLLIGGRMGEMPSSGYTLLDIPTRRRRWSMSIPAPRSSAASTSPTLAINATPAAFAAALEAHEPPARSRLAAETPSRRTPPISPGRQPPRAARARSSMARS